MARDSDKVASDDGKKWSLQLRELEVGGVGVGLGDDFAALTQILEVKEDGAAEILLDFAAGVPVGDATGKIR